jgi:predicted nucleotidyltransferase
MKDILIRAATLLENLKEKSIEGYALIGGLAVSAWAGPRATKDIDFLISVNTPLDINVPVVKQALLAEFNKTVTEHKSLHKGMWVLSMQEQWRLDFIIALMNWQAEIVESAITVNAFGVEMPVADVEGLIVLKLKAGGLQDQVDVLNLYPLADKDKLHKIARRLRLWKKLEALVSSYNPDLKK